MTKTFKVGEYGYHPYYRLTVTKENLIIFCLDSQKKRVSSRGFRLDKIEHIGMYLEDQTSSYYASIMLDWLYSTKEWKQSLITSNFFLQK